MKFSWPKITSKKQWVSLSLLLGFFAVIFFAPHAAHAGFSEDVAKFVGAGVATVIWLLGKLLVVLMSLVVWVAGYNNFIIAPAVEAGWEIVRDVCNMFFILLLLIIAFGTILNIKEYHWKHALPKLLLMAVLINFSKLICGVIIDFAQVVMLTFVNGFRDIAGGNLADMAGIMNLLNINSSSGEVGALSLAGTYILALMYVLVSLVVITVILFVLVMRIIMLWILVVLSPLAYLLSTTDKTKGYASQWWKQFGDNVVSGPLLAFFIWLSFVALQQSDIKEDKMFGPPPDQGSDTQYYSEISGSAGAASAGLATAGTQDGMLKFVISMGMLIGGLMITKQLSGAAGSIAGKGLDTISKGAKSLSGYNAVKDRVGAFNKQREAVRSEKINAFGERNFGRYLSAKGAVGGVVSGAKASIKTGISKGLDKTGSFGRAVKAPVNKYQTWKQDRAKRKDEEQQQQDRRRAAYVNNVYEDASGKYNAHTEDGKTFYRRQKKDARGNDIPNQYEYAEHKGQKVEKMSDLHYNLDRAWSDSMTNSRAFNNKRNKAEADKEKDKMANAGLTPAQLLGVLEDASASDHKRLAAALTLAVKEGFKSSGQVNIAQTLLKSKNNSLLTKQFNDDIDKKQAHLNYNLDTEEGRRKFAKRREEGKFDVLQADAYRMPNVIRALSDSMTDKEFIKHMEKVSAYSSKHNEAQEFGLRGYLNNQQPAIDANDNVHKARKVAPRITRDLNDAVRGISDSAEIKRVLEDVIEEMAISDIAKLKTESLKADSSWSPQVRDAYNESIFEIIKNFTGADISNLEKTRDANRKTVEQIKIIYSAERPSSGSRQDSNNTRDSQANNRPGMSRQNRHTSQQNSNNPSDDYEDGTWEYVPGDNNEPPIPPQLNP